MSRRTRTFLRRDKERYVRSFAEDADGHLNANDLKPAYRTLKKLHSKSTSRSAIRTGDGRLLSHLLLMRIRKHLLKYERPELSRLTPGRPTTDRDLALCVLVEHQREFRKEMVAACQSQKGI